MIWAYNPPTIEITGGSLSPDNPVMLNGAKKITAKDVIINIERDHPPDATFIRFSISNPNVKLLNYVRKVIQNYLKFEVLSTVSTKVLNYFSF
jgi:hypothetical protein